MDRNLEVKVSRKLLNKLIKQLSKRLYIGIMEMLFFMTLYKEYTRKTFNEISFA